MVCDTRESENSGCLSSCPQPSSKEGFLQFVERFEDQLRGMGEKQCIGSLAVWGIRKRRRGQRESL